MLAGWLAFQDGRTGTVYQRIIYSTRPRGEWRFPSCTVSSKVQKGANPADRRFVWRVSGPCFATCIRALEGGPNLIGFRFDRPFVLCALSQLLLLYTRRTRGTRIEAPRACCTLALYLSCPVLISETRVRLPDFFDRIMGMSQAMRARLIWTMPGGPTQARCAHQYIVGTYTHSYIHTYNHT